MRDSARSHPVEKGQPDPIFYRHLAAYRFAARFVPGRKVLDLGCGDGYGSALLAETASSVFAVDGHAPTITAAGKRYVMSNLRFAALDFSRGFSLDERFDVAVSMQVVEHMPDDASFVANLKAVLAPDGVAIISTPNRLRTVFPNPLHCREYLPEEFALLCATAFQYVDLYGVTGNRKVEDWLVRRHRVARMGVALGLSRIQRALPTGLLLRLYGCAEAFTHLNLFARSGSAASAIAANDFDVRPDALSDSLDLIAVCRSR